MAPHRRALRGPSPTIDVLTPLLVLAGLCVSVPLTAVVAAGEGRSAGTGVTATWMLALSLPLLWRRRRPSTVAAVVAVVFVAGQVLAVPEELMGQLALTIALYTVGAVDPDRRRAWLVRGAVVAMIAVWIAVALLREPVAAGTDATGAGGGPSEQLALVVLSVLGNVVVLALATALGEIAWVAASRQADLQARTEQLQQERDRVAVQAIALDRMRIARELHDVVAHHVSLMGVHASLARRLMATSPDRASAALDEVETAARGAVQDLGGLLTTLREETADATSPVEGAGAPTVGPVPTADPPSTAGLHRVPELVEQARRGGLRVHLHAGAPEELAAVPALAGFAIHRVVQEALTNSRKHAPTGARVDVLIDVRPGHDDHRPADAHGLGRDVVLVRITQEGGGDEGGGGQPVAPGTGRGLTGMRERVEAAGGRLAVERRGADFVVTAVLPLRARTS